MKNVITFLTYFLIAGFGVYAQVGINADNSSPDPSAMLDVRSTSRGMLAPRLSMLQRNAISNPATGLLIFCTDNNLFYYNAGTPVTPNWLMINSQWLTTPSGISYTGGNVGIGVTDPSASLDVRGGNPDLGGVIIAGNSDLSHRLILYSGSQNDPLPFINWKGGEPFRFTTDEGGWSEKMRITSDGRLAVGTSAPSQSALLDLSSNSKGLLPPRLTFDQRSAIASPAEGLMVFCTNCTNVGTGVLSIYQSGKWMNLNNLSCDIPAAPWSVSSIYSSPSKIIWTWHSRPIATGYKFSSVPYYPGAIDLGSDTVFISSDLLCSTEYFGYAWAYNECGNSSPLTMIQSTQACPAFTCGIPLVINHVSGPVAPVTKTVTYGTVNGVGSNGTQCWITQNLGADHQATSVNDATEPSAGWYWQFNRKQGYKHDGTVVTPDWNPSVINEWVDWTSANDPCYLELGNPWRIPTDTEWAGYINSLGGGNWNACWSSPLKLHAAGSLAETTGALSGRGTDGALWSSTEGSLPIIGVHLLFNSTMVVIQSDDKWSGKTVRCIRD